MEQQVDYKLTVLVLTYNQDCFIMQTIESIVKQQTSFPFEILICDDGSTDNTHDILKELQKQHANIKLVLRDKNIGILPNFMDGIHKCDKEFIAFCDGDDYWIDFYKLENQVKYLEKKRKVHITASRVLIKYHSNDDLIKEDTANNAGQFTFDRLLEGNLVVASSVVMRNKRIALPAWLSQSIYGDWPYYLLSMDEHELGHISEDYTVVYRKNIGVTKDNYLRRSHFLEGTLYIYKYLLNTDKFRSKRVIIKRAIFDNSYLLMGVLNQNKKRAKAFMMFISLISSSHFSQLRKLLKRYIKTLLIK